MPPRSAGLSKSRVIASLQATAAGLSGLRDHRPADSSLSGGPTRCLRWLGRFEAPRPGWRIYSRSVVRNHVYHPDFGGSFGLKNVLPAMVPEPRYDTLAIGDGETASLELERLLSREAELTPEAKAQLRSDLLRYCGQDTWGLVTLLERLRRLGWS